MYRSIFIVCLLLCAVNPVTAQQDLELMTQSEEIDLNGDGITDTVIMDYVKYSIWEPGYPSRRDFTLRVNDVEIESSLEPDLTGFEIVDIDKNDDMVEILIPTMGPSYDPCCLIYSYDGENIVETGKLAGFREFTGEGVIYTDWWQGFWEATDKWVLNPETHKLEQIPQEMYYIGCTGDHLEIRESFDLHLNPGSDEIVETIEAGGSVSVIACLAEINDTDYWSWHLYIPSDWFLLRAESGLTGWVTGSEFFNVTQGFGWAD